MDLGMCGLQIPHCWQIFRHKALSEHPVPMPLQMLCRWVLMLANVQTQGSWYICCRLLTLVLLVLRDRGLAQPGLQMSLSLASSSLPFSSLKVCWHAGIIMLTLTLLNILIASTGTTGSIPVTMYFALVAIWFVVSIPLTYVGGYLATKTPLIVWPTRTNQIPRHIPDHPAASDPYVLYAAAGILPFCTVFIELYFVMSSMWHGFFYYLFGFMFIVTLLTVIITVEVSILCTCVLIPCHLPLL